MVRLTALAVLSLLANPLAAYAQTNPAPGTPGTPEDKKISGLITPERVTSEMEAIAKKNQDSGRAPSIRGREYYFSWSSTTPAEFEALARHVLFLFSIWTQKADGLPVKRIYVRADGRELPLLKVSSWSAPVDRSSITAKMFGSYREDGFYLMPGVAMLRKGEIVLDHGSQTGWVMMELPSNVAMADANRFANTDPAPNAKPNIRALQGLIQHRFPGFPVPQSLQ
jgi:hypothetical protein